MRLLSLGLAAALLSSCAMQESTTGYHLAQTVPVEGNGHWDYVRVDEKGRRVYIGHDSQVEVLDADTGAWLTRIDGLKGVHGIAVASEAKRGFITEGKNNDVVEFDTVSFKKGPKIKVGKKPDAIAYDHFTNRVFAMNGDSDSMTVIDADSSKVVGTIALGGDPEFAVSDNKGHLYVNIEETSETLQIDTKEMKVLARWPVAPGSEPSALAMDRENDRLFVGCRNKTMVVLNAENGKVVATVPLGEHVDAAAYDPETHNVFASNDDGTLTVVAQDDEDKYHVTQTIQTPKRSKNLGLDKKTHKLFVPAAEFSTKVSAPTKAHPHPRPDLISGSFKVLVYEP